KETQDEIRGEVSLVRERIDTQAVIGRLKQPADGAAVIFDGVVRDNTRGRCTLYLDYEDYAAMALTQMDSLAVAAGWRLAAPRVLRAASVELRADGVRISSWLVARSSQRTAPLILCILTACASGRSMAQEPETTLKVDVKLVNVFVTVTDARGAPVASLQKENFLLKEDGKEQKIAIFSRESALPLS